MQPLSGKRILIFAGDICEELQRWCSKLRLIQGPINRLSAVMRLGVVLLSATLFLCGCGAESAKWDVAEAQNLYEAGDLSGAIELLDAAHQKMPQSDYIQLQLARCYAENGQYELGVGLCDEYLKDHPNDVKGFAIRAECWQNFGKYDEALVDYKRSLSDHVSRNSTELNNLAYFRGLANKEINKATVDIQTAIEALETAVRGSGVRIPLQVRTVVIAGLVSRSIGQHEEAIKFLDWKIEQYEEKLSMATEVLKTRVTGSLRYQDRLTKREELDLLELRANLQGQEESLAAMLVARALVLDDLGEDDESVDRDRRAIAKMGYEFEDVSNRLPSDFNCLGALREAGTFLDTRGFVLGRQKWTTDDHLQSLLAAPAETQLLYSNYSEALADLDLAVLAARFENLALDSSLCNSTELPTEEVKRLKKRNKRNRAVLLSHRKEVHLRGGNKEAAAADQKSIDELGFSDSRLF